MINFEFWQVTDDQPQAALKSMINFDAPILCTDWSPDCSKIYAGGTDNKVKVWDIQPEMKLMVTGSWDKTLRYWDLRSPKEPVISVNLPERVYGLDVHCTMMAVATADHKIRVYNLDIQNIEYTSMDSPLKHQTRSIACFKDLSGFAVGSIEGRVAIEYIDDKKSQSFLFRCHREPTPGSTVDNVQCQ
ncbi:hypothetical protein PPL_11244 [Heterostelium album PN500]|uniref:Uncharacterized protein n=1 Tax=Heterostelium pallidum (strain ATCC 26659 / Pp 5 / PN500) TaxID=670386 RepID=D3BTY4_HETP5|nr:hypothetical protein PPL_11244 [Heterostelium album PN500]EFA75170.1 hypothetical protein PPL_11244 [Heterostelium album PN500]|eukprot:XP_020427304.1 hypothetical protein PPL_11244 [Heterostelium album PN500]